MPTGPSETVAASWYAQSRLRELVASLDDGARLPAERELAAQWRVARETLRSAIGVLAEEGVLVSRHGSGTYVARTPIIRALGLKSFTEDLADRGLTATTRVLDFRVTPVDAVTAQNLEVTAGTEVVAFTRVRYADGIPVGVERSWLVAASVPGLAAADVERSLYEVLEDRFGLAPRRASSVIGAGDASASEAELLGLQAGDACLRIRMIDRGVDDRVFMVAECAYHPERYQLRAELNHPGRAT